jgi:CheY-like chemotaxis protein
MATVVIVDDDRVFRELLKTVLQMEGYDPVPCTEPDEVVAMVREAQPALVLMDVHIHNQDTLGALGALKADPELGDIPVVMFSGMDRADECLEAGADAFVLKPFRPSQLLDTISRLLETSE